jgi:hypothetical protein
MQARHQVIARVARIVVLNLIGASLVSVVGCGKAANPVGLGSDFDKNSQVSPIDRGIQTAGATPIPLPVDLPPVDPPLSGSINVTIDDQSLSWAYQVRWNAIDKAIAYQLSQYSVDKDTWVTVTQTKSTECMVPRILAPNSLIVRVRPLFLDGHGTSYGGFSNTAHVGLAVSTPTNLVISNAGWAWHLKWDASRGYLGKYQIFEFHAATANWTLLAETHKTEFLVPMAYAPNSLTVRVRAIDTDGNSTVFSTPAQMPALPAGIANTPSGGGGGGGALRTTFE